MIRVQAQTALDDLTTLEQKLLDRQLVLNGVFKDEIARLLDVQRETEERLGMVDTVADAAKVKVEADAYAAATRAAAEKTSAAASGALASANAKMEAALTKERSVADREAQALSVMADYQAKADDFDAECARREAALATREAALVAREQALQQATSDFAAQKSAQLAKLEQARALVSG